MNLLSKRIVKSRAKLSLSVLSATNIKCVALLRDALLSPARGLHLLARAIAMYRALRAAGVSGRKFRPVSVRANENLAAWYAIPCQYLFLTIGADGYAFRKALRVPCSFIAMNHIQPPIKPFKSFRSAKAPNEERRKPQTPINGEAE